MSISPFDWTGDSYYYQYQYPVGGRVRHPNYQSNYHTHPHHHYFTDPSVNMPGVPLPINFPLLPHFHTNGAPSSNATNLLSSPLPTAMFPLPLDPLCPPAVLPSSFSNGTSQSSGYSTAGHSRSSSPMAQLPKNALGGSEHQGGGQQGSSYLKKTSHEGGGDSNAVEQNGDKVEEERKEGNGDGISTSGPSAQHLSGERVYQFQSTNHEHFHASPNLVYEAPSTEITLAAHFPSVPGQYIVYFHINPGVSVSFNNGDHYQVYKGPMTVPLVTTNSNPPIPLPMQVPPGHVIQQIVDESGTLRHVIVSHQPPLMPMPNYGLGNQNQPYYPHPQHFSPPFIPCNMQSGQGGPTNGGPNLGAMGGNYGPRVPLHSQQRDERTIRQITKLRKKYEQKQQTVPPHLQNGTFSKKDGGYMSNNNNTRRNVVPNGVNMKNGEENGSVGSTGSVTSTGTQDEEEETRIQNTIDMLSAILSPIVSELTCRSAFIKWSVPDRWTESGENKYPEIDVSDSEFTYEVYISDRSREESLIKCIFTGSALSCRVKDLKPGTSYGISYSAILHDIKGNTSQATNFTTLPSEPDAPLSPRAMKRERNSLNFKWAAPTENGSKITAYLLEYDEGKGGSHFVEVYRGKNKQCTVTKLQPAYSYQFRLAAINEIGQSKFSPTTTVMTAGSPPPQPSPPTLRDVGVSHLSLVWESSGVDEGYSLQMDDPRTGHGFLAAYNGSAPHFTSTFLSKFTPYKFRVKAYNAEGHSKWSEEVTFRTLPDRPSAPGKPTLKGRTHSSYFKVKWDPPADTGGVPISCYVLEIDAGNGTFEEVYRGTETEFNVDKLSPGQSYPLRVSAVGEGGQSPPSDLCVITTEPICPGKCHIPKIVGKPKSNSVHLKWTSPDWDGGSPVTYYEVSCTTPSNETEEAYRGRDTSCFINGLLPGRSYVFQIRAFNRIGPGLWSEPLEVISGPGAPDGPSSFKISPKSAHSLSLSWQEPLNNGSAVTEYRVQMATRTLVPLSPPPPETLPIEEEGKKSEEEGGENEKAEERGVEERVTAFSQVYVGSSTYCEIKGLQPSTTYLFRLQAVNCAGSSEWSPISSHLMPPSSPNAVNGVEATSTSSSISLTWHIPHSNGSPITHYNIMLGDTLLTSLTNSYTISNLIPDTHYKIRVQGVNGVGPGPFSTSIKSSTRPLPPSPPKVELVSSSHYWLKLKWSGGEGGSAKSANSSSSTTTTSTSSSPVEFIVQMINPYMEDFQVVYRGNIPSCKVGKLSEETEYQFRICGQNGAGQGQFSELYKFTTLKAPPPQIKGLKVVIDKEGGVFRFEWSDVGKSDVIYHFQIAKKKELEYKTIYKGEERKVELDFKEVDEGVDYVARVSGIRHSDEVQITGPFSTLVFFSTPISDSELANSKSLSSSTSFKNISATAQVIEKMNIGYESRVGIMAVLALLFLGIIISLIVYRVVS